MALAADVAGALVPFATGAGAAVRLAAHADDALDVARAVGAANDESQFVYRALREGEDPAKGLIARNPGMQSVEPYDHVRMSSSEPSPWISTTKNPQIARDKYDSGSGIVEIDLSLVETEVVDLSNGIPGRISDWARDDREVLIRDDVPPEAIIRKLR